MKKNLYETVQNLLKQDKTYLSEDNKLLKQKIYEDCMTMKPELISLLLTNEKIKEEFFVQVNDILVFDKQKFTWFINSKEFLPDSYTKYKNKIGLTNNGEFISQSENVVLDFPYKDCYLQGGQTKDDDKRNEIMFNEIIAKDEITRMLEPKVFANAKRYTKDGIEENIEFRDKDNLIIKGNNLIALSSILKRYEGKVKCIYIDPPYNTGSDGFNYNDNFNHSTWLTFMKNRLEIAKQLLAENGFLFVQCDDNEQAYLQILLNEIFNITNHKSNIYIETVYPQKTLKQDRIFHDQIEQVLIYSKSNSSKIKQTYSKYSYEKFCWEIIETGPSSKTLILGGKKVQIFDENCFKIKKINPSLNGLKEIWASGTILDMNSSGRFFRDFLMGRHENDGYNKLYKVYDIGDDNNNFRYFSGPKKIGATKGKYYQGVPTDKINSNKDNLKKVSIENFWPMAGEFGNCRTEGGVEFKSGKKPEKLIKKILDISTDERDIVLDFFIGSGTTAAVAHKMNRQYIGIEQLNYNNNDSIKRLQNVISGDTSGISKIENWQGGGSFVYCELKENAQELIDKIIACTTDEDIMLLKESIYSDERIIPYITSKDLHKADEDFKDLSLENKKQALIEIINKNKLYVNYSDLENNDFYISESEKKFTKSFYKK